MGFTLEAGAPAITVFLQGVLSFFSPCVLPLVPLYLGYLAGGARTAGVDGEVGYERRKILGHTICFVAGVSFAFFLLGLGFTVVGQFFSGNRTMLARVGGVLVILFGVLQVTGTVEKYGRERRLPLRLDRLTMNPLAAFLLGFVFSFAWTPCVGPALASVLLMASSAATATAGFALVGVYTLGFVLPFLVVGLFTGAALGFFKKYRGVVRYTVRAGGVLMILMGVMMLTGWMNGATGYLSRIGGAQTAPAVQQKDETPAADSAQPEPPAAAGQTQKPPLPPAEDFTLTDQFGQTHTLSDYQGKTVFLNFWATWCGPCQKEMPDIQKLYEEYGGNAEDLIILGVANPKTEEAPWNADNKTPEEVAQFLTDGGFSYPVVMDVTGDVFAAYGVSAYPTTFMIDKDGNVFGYAPGSLTYDIMQSIVRQTMAGARDNPQ